MHLKLYIDVHSGQCVYIIYHELWFVLCALWFEVLEWELKNNEKELHFYHHLRAWHCALKKNKSDKFVLHPVTEKVDIRSPALFFILTFFLGSSDSDDHFTIINMTFFSRLNCFWTVIVNNSLRLILFGFKDASRGISLCPPIVGSKQVVPGPG